MILAGGNGGASKGLDNIISDHHDFASVVRYELKRSERYCSFVSILTVRLDSLHNRLMRKFPANPVMADDFVAHMFKAIRTAIRVTDIVSTIDRDRVGLLLVETPKEGAVVLAKRLSDHLSDYFERTGELTSTVKPKIEIGSYPDSDNSTVERMLEDFTG